MDTKLDNSLLNAKHQAISLINEQLHIDKQDIKSIILQTKG